MKPLTVQAIAQMCGGLLLCGDGAQTARAVNTDSRRIERGDVFVALVGEKFDAHEFILQVANDGAAVVIVSRIPGNASQLGCAVIQVQDTLIALQRLAAAHRKLLNPLVIGITGSNGKTSTKDFCATVLKNRFTVRATVGNLNNHIGVPLTLLALNEGDDCAVVEMGMNHAGEIAPLCAIAQPDVAIITNIGVAHIEFMGSRAAIAQEKGVLAEAVHENGLVVLNADDEFTPSIANRTKAKVLTAGIGNGDVRATPQQRSAAGTHFALQFPDGASVNVFLPVPGLHMVSNAALAAACAWHHGVSPIKIAEALAVAQLTKGRMQVKIVNGITFINDHYNANPDSMKAGLRTLADVSEATRRIAVLGSMGELGAHAEQGHREVGEYAANVGVDAVFTVGAEAGLISEAAHSIRAGITAKHFETHAECAAHLRGWLRRSDAVLVKGSRSAAMEKISELLQS